MKVSVVSKLTDRQVEQLVALYSNEFWCSHRKQPDVERMLKHSDIVIGAEDSDHNFVGFVRVLTDYVYKATIFDLIVHPNWRGQNLGRFLMDTVVSHPDLRDVEHFDLNCLPEMYKFYEKWGFTSEVGKLGFMRRFNCMQQAPIA